jgi:hypothetical protein
MPKILTDNEMIRIIGGAPDEIECADSYQHFLEDLRELICNHFGGEPGGEIGRPDHDLGWTAGFVINDCVPDDGGVYADYDTDVIWENGYEHQT